MPLKNYHVLKGNPSDLAVSTISPHIEIRLEAEGVSYRIAVNIRSKISPHDLLYYTLDHFQHPKLAKLEKLPYGQTNIADGNADLAFDYVRDGLFRRSDMQIVPFEDPHTNNNLQDDIEPLIRQAIGDKTTSIYAFGEMWGPYTNTSDQYFDFKPENGVHDIHMNQGSSDNFSNTNGIHQDGALLIHFAKENRWHAIFLAFQSQSWDTDSHGDPAA